MVRTVRLLGVLVTSEKRNVIHLLTPLLDDGARCELHLRCSDEVP